MTEPREYLPKMYKHLFELFYSKGYRGSYGELHPEIVINTDNLRPSYIAVVRKHVPFGMLTLTLEELEDEGNFYPIITLHYFISGVYLHFRDTLGPAMSCKIQYILEEDVERLDEFESILLKTIPQTEQNYLENGK